jgi:hypothetical protein
LVFAGCLDTKGEGAKQLLSEGGANLIVVQLNVISEDDITKALDTITKHLDERAIHGLILIYTL